MGLPPLELFSLKERAAYCRAALSVFTRPVPPALPGSHRSPPSDRSMSHRIAHNARCSGDRRTRVQDLPHRTSDIWARRTRSFGFRILDDVVRNWLRSDRTG